MNADVWEILWTGTVSGVVSGVIVTVIIAVVNGSKGKLLRARRREAVHARNGKFYHWMSECERFPIGDFEAGTGGKESCMLCEMLTSMAYEKWSMFRLPWYKRLLKKRRPDEDRYRG